MLAACIRHPDRLVEVAACSTVVRDGVQPVTHCACCDGCRALCLATPHGHGGTPATEWRNGVCLICGIPVP